MSQLPKKFLWPGLLEFFVSKTSETTEALVALLAKLDIVKDPGSQMSMLADIFNHRQLMLTLLLQVDKIQLTLPQLIFALERLQHHSEQTLDSCFK